jgi:hypothetical protein
MKPLISLVLLMSLAFLLTCGGGGFRQLVSLTLEPSVADGNTEFAGHPVQFSATGTYDHEPFTQANVTAQWAVIDSNIADIGASTGTATCRTGGATVVTASAAGKGGQVQGSATLHCRLVGYCELSPGTNTLSGMCVAADAFKECSEASDTVNCPPGQPAKSPDIYFGCHPADFNIDRSRNTCNPVQQ